MEKGSKGKDHPHTLTVLGKAGGNPSQQAVRQPEKFTREVLLKPKNVDSISCSTVEHKWQNLCPLG